MKLGVRYIIAGPDEQSNRDFKKILDGFSLLAFQGSITTFQDAKKYVWEKSLDLAFIRIGEVAFNAYELFNEIRSRNPLSKVVFMSNHEEYALEAFECEVDGFLLIPFEEGKVENLIGRIFQEQEHQRES